MSTLKCCQHCLHLTSNTTQQTEKNIMYHPAHLIQFLMKMFHVVYIISDKNSNVLYLIELCQMNFLWAGCNTNAKKLEHPEVEYALPYPHTLHPLPFPVNT